MTTATSITVRVPLTVRRRPGRKTVVTPMAAGPAAVTTRADPALVKALARAFRYQRMLDEGRYASITEMAAAERLERGYMGSLLRLTLLAPDLGEAILNGQQPGELALPRLMRPFSTDWTAQRFRFGRGSNADHPKIREFEPRTGPRFLQAHADSTAHSGAISAAAKRPLDEVGLKRPSPRPDELRHHRQPK